MARRLLPLLLAVLVFAGTTAASCPQWLCASMKAASAGHAAAMQAQGAHDGHHAAHGGSGSLHAGDHASHPGMHAVAASAHDCCDRAGLTRPPCCPTTYLASERAPSAGGRAGDVVQIAAAQAAPFALPVPAPVRRDTPRRFDPGASPGTLIQQHTSLLV